MSFWPSDTASRIADVIGIATAGVPLWRWLAPKIRDKAATSSIARRRRRIAVLTEELKQTENILAKTNGPMHHVLFFIIAAMASFFFGVAIVAAVNIFPLPLLIKVIGTEDVTLLTSGLAGNLMVTAFRENRQLVHFSDYKDSVLARIKKLEQGMPRERMNAVAKEE